MLNKQSVLEYLSKKGICRKEELSINIIEPQLAENYNLLVSLSDGRKLLVKQKYFNHEGEDTDEFLNEWKIQDFIKNFSALCQIQTLFPQILHLNKNHSIIIVNYLNKYRDLTDFYIRENVFPSEIATSIGSIVGQIHRQTFNCQEYQEFLSQACKAGSVNNALKTFRELKQIDPEVYSLFPTEGLKFFVLYQRHEVLGQAIAELATSFCPCCLTHNNLKLNNILLHIDWKQVLFKNKITTESIMCLINWKFSGWGDPAFDLGMLITGYLKIWLHNLIFDKAMSIEDSLRAAAIPLEQLQPSIAALTKAYLDNFPEILDHRTDFLQRVVQYSGLGLIHQIQAKIQYQKTFGNISVCMLQVAKTLICHPEQSMSTVFGKASVELTQPNSAAA